MSSDSVSTASQSIAKGIRILDSAASDAEVAAARREFPYWHGRLQTLRKQEKPWRVGLIGFGATRQFVDSFEAIEEAAALPWLVAACYDEWEVEFARLARERKLSVEWASPDAGNALADSVSRDGATLLIDDTSHAQLADLFLSHGQSVLGGKTTRVVDLRSVSDWAGIARAVQGSALCVSLLNDVQLEQWLYVSYLAAGGTIWATPERGKRQSRLRYLDDRNESRIELDVQAGRRLRPFFLALQNLPREAPPSGGVCGLEWMENAPFVSWICAKRSEPEANLLVRNYFSDCQFGGPLEDLALEAICSFLKGEADWETLKPFLGMAPDWADGCAMALMRRHYSDYWETAFLFLRSRNPALLSSLREGLGTLSVGDRKGMARIHASIGCAVVAGLSLKIGYHSVEEAQTGLQLMLSDPSAENLWPRLGLAACLANNDGRVSAGFKALATDSPASRVYFRFIADHYRAAGDLEAAWKYYECELQANGESRWSNVFGAQVRWMRGDYRAAIEFAEKEESDAAYTALIDMFFGSSHSLLSIRLDVLSEEAEAVATVANRVSEPTSRTRRAEAVSRCLLEDPAASSKAVESFLKSEPVPEWAAAQLRWEWVNRAIPIDEIWADTLALGDFKWVSTWEQVLLTAQLAIAEGPGKPFDALPQVLSRIDLIQNPDARWPPLALAELRDELAKAYLRCRIWSDSEAAHFMKRLLLVSLRAPFVLPRAFSETQLGGSVKMVEGLRMQGDQLLTFLEPRLLDI